MNPTQKLAASKAGEHMGRRPMDPKPKGKNFLQKAGEFITGGATADQLTSPSWWGRGLVNEANRNIVQPIYRTASGQNLRTAVAPSSTLNQRINAIGEDALNVISVIPGAGTAARASVAAEQAGARALSRARGIKPTAPTVGNQVSPRLTQKIQQTTIAQQEALDRARAALTPDRPEYDFDQEGFIRFWHTSQDGGPLPFPLQSVEEAANLASRRGGGGGTNLLDGGLYNTEAGTVSGLYGKDTVAPPYHLPGELRDQVVDLKRVQTDFMHDPVETARQSQMYSADLLDSAISIDDAIPNKYAFETRSKIPPSLIEAYDSSTTYRDLLNAVPSELHDDLLKQIGVPLKFTSDKPTVLNINTRTGRQNLFADPDNPVYFIGSRESTPFGPRLRNYSITKRSEPKNRFVKQLGELETELALAQNLYFKKMQLNPGSALSTKEARDHLAYVDTLKRQIANAQEQIQIWSQPSLNDIYNVAPGFSVTPGQNYFDLPIERSIVPRTSPEVLAREQATRGFRINDAPGNPAISIRGQQLRSNDEVANNAGMAITSIDGLPALDIGNLSESQIESIRGALNKFFSQNNADPSQAQEAMEMLDDYLYYINYPNPDPVKAGKFKLDKFRTAMSNAWNSIPVNPSAYMRSDEISNKEKLYNFLRDELGYASMPHPGGVTVGDIPHQAVVFSRPELLPPATYVPSKGVDFTRAMSDYNSSLVRRHFMQQRQAGNSNLMDIPQASPNITAAQRMANRMALAGFAQSTRNR